MIWQHMITLKKARTGAEEDYTTGCLLDYIYFKVYYRWEQWIYVNNKN